MSTASWRRCRSNGGTADHRERPGPPQVAVEPAQVHVRIERGGQVHFETDANGEITGAKID